MAELVDALVSDASEATRGSSSLLGRTKYKDKFMNKTLKSLFAISMMACSLSLTGCGKYVSSYQAVGLVRSNVSNSAYLNFHSLKGRIAFHLNHNKDNQVLEYGGYVETGTVNVFYDDGNGKNELFTVSSTESVTSTLEEFNRGIVYVIVETDGKCGNGNFHFDIKSL